MRFTRRLVDRRSSAVVIPVYCLLVAGASCASTEEKATPPPSDSLDAALPDADHVAVDAGVDAAPVFDGGPLPIVCTSPPCARSLVTTPPTAMPAPNAPTEGFCALLDDGTVACWGADGSRQSSPPEGTFQQVDAGGSHTCGLRTNGTVACWGWNNSGETDVPAELL